MFVYNGLLHNDQGQLLRPWSLWGEGCFVDEGKGVVQKIIWKMIFAFAASACGCCLANI